MKTKFLLLTLAILGTASGHVHARTVDWGGAVGDSLFTSAGSIFDDSMIFELGSFGTSFTPTDLNMDQWLTNWKVFDRATAGNGWNSTDQFIASSANLTTSGTSSESPPLPSFTFAQGEQGYIWAYKTDQTYAPGLEWALITNNGSDGISTNDWLFPAHSDQTGLPLQWRFSTASTPIFGALNNVQGAGSFSTDPVGEQLQTHTVAAVPEPGGALLIAAAGLMVRLRRRRS